MPEISIIVPVYNVEKYLSQCIESIKSQTFEDWELILVDDGSPDNSGIICDEYAKTDRRIKVVHQENGGVSTARNLGLENAKGEYISFIDSDDYIAPEFLKVMLDKLLTHNADMVRCGFHEFNDRNGVFNTCQFENEKVYPPPKCCSSPMDLYFDSVLFKVPWNAIYKREIALKVSFPEGLINEDNYSAGMHLFYSKKIVCIKDKLYFYRDTNNSLSRQGYSKKLFDVALVTSKLYEDLISEGCTDAGFLLRLRKKIAREIFHCVKNGKPNIFKLIWMDKGFYQFVLNHLDLRRGLLMRFYKVIGKFGVR